MDNQRGVRGLKGAPDIIRIDLDLRKPDLGLSMFRKVKPICRVWVKPFLFLIVETRLKLFGLQSIDTKDINNNLLLSTSRSMSSITDKNNYSITQLIDKHN